MPAVEQVAFAWVVADVRVSPVETFLVRAPAQMPFAQLPYGFLVSGVDDRCFVAAAPVFRADEFEAFAGERADDGGVVRWREREFESLEYADVGGGQSLHWDRLVV